MVLHAITVTSVNRRRRVFMISDDVLEIVFITICIIMSAMLPFSIYYEVIIDKDNEKQ
jgi:hypothetical protein